MHNALRSNVARTLIPVAILLLVFASIVARGRPTHAMAFFRASKAAGVGGPDFADLVTHPADFFRWQHDTIYYHVAPSFDQTFSDPRFRDQIALAFGTWSRASIRPHGAVDSYYTSAGGSEAFYDFRSLTTHEIGHALGLAHPDEAAAAGRNFAHDATGVLVPAPASSNWVMSTIVGSDMTTYNQSLAWDDLNAFAYAYAGRQLSFMPVPFITKTGIVIRATNFKLNPTLYGHASAGVSKDLAAHTTIRYQNTSLVTPGADMGGRHIWRATIWFNTLQAPSVGVHTRKINWELVQPTAAPGTPTPQPIRGIQVQTRRANVTEMLDHLDNPALPPGAPQPFTWYETIRNNPALDDLLLHVWSDPAAGDIAADAAVEVGVEADVRNLWTRYLRVIHPGTSETTILNSDFATAGVQSIEVLGSFAARSEVDGSRMRARPSSAASQEPREVVASGVLLENRSEPRDPVVLTHLALGDATRGGETDPASITLQTLTRAQIEDRFTMFSIPVTRLQSAQTLDPGESFQVFVTGDRDRLPPSEIGHVFLADMPEISPDALSALSGVDLTGVPLVVMLTGEVAGASITTFTLLGAPPITGIEADLSGIEDPFADSPPACIYLPFLGGALDLAPPAPF